MKFAGTPPPTKSINLWTGNAWLENVKEVGVKLLLGSSWLLLTISNTSLTLEAVPRVALRVAPPGVKVPLVSVSES